MRNQHENTNDSVKEHQKNQQQKLDELQLKNEHYQKIKHKYFEGQEPSHPLFDESTTSSKQGLTSSDQEKKGSKLKISSKAFDPEFIRDEPIGFGHSSRHASYYPPGLL